MGHAAHPFFIGGVVKENGIDGRNELNELNKLNAFVGRAIVATPFTPFALLNSFNPKNLE